MPDAVGDPLTYNIIGAAMEVHGEFGPGFLEPVYQGALAIELRRRGVPHEREVQLPVTYRGEPTGAPYRADFICDRRVLVELKAHKALGAADVAQVVHYLKATGLRLGILLNFGAPRLERRRVIYADDWLAKAIAEPATSERI